MNAKNINQLEALQIQLIYIYTIKILQVIISYKFVQNTQYLHTLYLSWCKFLIYDVDNMVLRLQWHHCDPSYEGLMTVWPLTNDYEGDLSYYVY